VASISNPLISKERTGSREGGGQVAKSSKFFRELCSHSAVSTQEGRRRRQKRDTLKRDAIKNPFPQISGSSSVEGSLASLGGGGDDT